MSANVDLFAQVVHRLSSLFLSCISANTHLSWGGGLAAPLYVGYRGGSDVYDKSTEQSTIDASGDQAPALIFIF